MALEFKAAGDEATAMQRAQESGCLPETVLALAALTDYRIVGSEEDNGILRIEDSWPAAWRIHATRCHRALASGCYDDIDLILRIFSEWQSSDSPDGWCAMWWVNPSLMHQVEADVGAVFGSLAAAGPLGMRRPVDVRRAPLVREALADAFDEAFFERVGQNHYRPFGEDPADGPAFKPTSMVLTEPGQQIIALGKDLEANLLEHIICVDHVGFPDDPLAAVRKQWPVGSIVDIQTLGSVAAGRVVTDILTLHRGFPFPEGVTPSVPDTAASTPPLLAAPAHGTAPIDGSNSVRVRVLGYRLSEEDEAVLLVDPIASDAPIDPADHPDLGTWDDIEVMVRGVASDYYGPLVELGRTDGYGSFFVPPDAGLSDTDTGFGKRLTEGAQLTARVLPEPPNGDTLTVSLLPEAIRHLESMPGIDNQKPVPATVIHNDGRLTTVTVELDHRDPASGISHRFDVERGRLMEGFTPVVGTPVDVVLRPDRSRARRRLRADEQLRNLVADSADVFSIVNGWVELSPAPPDIASVVALLTIDESSAWEHEVVWFYEDNLHLEAALIGPSGDAQLAEVAATLAGFLVQHPSRAASPQETPEALVDEEPATDQEDLESTEPVAEVLHGGEHVPEPVVPVRDVRRMVARLPDGAAARVEGPDGAALAELRAGPEVLAVVLEDDLVTVVAETGRAARSVMSEIQRLILPAKGRLLMPPGGAKRLIGIDGTTLRALQVRTGCEAHDPGDGELWIVEGPSHAAVKEFMRLASEQVPGVVGRVTDMEDIKLLVDESVLRSDLGDASAAAGREIVPGSAAIAGVAVGDPVDGPGDTQSESDEAPKSPRRTPIRPLKKSRSYGEEEPAQGLSRAEHRAAKAEARAKAKAEKAEARAEKKRADEAVVATAATTAAGSTAAADAATNQPIGSTPTRTPMIAPLIRGAALLLAMIAIGAALWFVADNVFGEEGPAGTATTAASATDDQPESAAAVPAFEQLDDASTATPASCWLAVMATWDDPAQAVDGVTRIQDAGLPATSMDSNRVPNWAADRTVGVVPTETAEQAAEAVTRAGDVGFRGVAIESTPAGCTGLDVIPAGASLGFIDVPVSDADHAAILWTANTALLEACNPPSGDQYCPTAPVTRGELALVLDKALVAPPEPPADLAAPATVGDLESALGSGPADAATPLVRRTLARTLYSAHGTAGN